MHLAIARSMPEALLKGTIARGQALACVLGSTEYLVCKFRQLHILTAGCTSFLTDSSALWASL